MEQANVILKKINNGIIKKEVEIWTQGFFVFLSGQETQVNAFESDGFLREEWGCVFQCIIG